MLTLSRQSGPFFIVVRNPKPRILPQIVRGLLGEQCLAVDVHPFWVQTLGFAKRFHSRAIAESYIYYQVDRKGRRAGFETAIVRKVRA